MNNLHQARRTKATCIFINSKKGITSSIILSKLTNYCTSIIVVIKRGLSTTFWTCLFLITFGGRSC